MKRKLIKALSMVLVSVALFVMVTGFKPVGATNQGVITPIVNQSYYGGHSDYTVCGTNCTYIYGEWSDKYKVGSFSLNVAWYTTYERSRSVYKVCTDCQRVISVETQYQQRSYAFGFIPSGGWYLV